MPGSAYNSLFNLAEDQMGYVTSFQAEQAGIPRNTLVNMARRGVLERVSHGVYQVTAFPGQRWGQYMAATLWPYGTRGVLSHETALFLYEISDVLPAKVHITVPIGFRIQRIIPRHLMVHHEELSRHNITLFETMPITTPTRSIIDCFHTHLGPDLIKQAVMDGRKKGLLKTDDLKRLYKEIGIRA